MAKALSANKLNSCEKSPRLFKAKTIPINMK